ncbi:MAG: hypothetical protein GF390_01605 [Candidatus Pacebacteria bacterium]|nr:hypothetical protein [Candidatus Paceibacterota bacterium]
MSKKLILISLSCLSLSLCYIIAPMAQAQRLQPSPTSTPTTAPASPTATESGSLASASAEVEQKIQEKKAQDITETTGEKKSELVAYLDQHPVESPSWHNFLQHAIRRAIEKGLPANIVVLMILFPLIASVIAVSRHVIGLRGFGIYIPAVLSVAFVSTEIVNGVIIFSAVLLAALATRKVIKKLRLPYLPRTAMLLWGVSIFTLLLLIGAAYYNLTSLISVSIFPLLIIILLTENFITSQLFNSQKEATKLTIETLLIAVLCAMFISLTAVQKFVLLRPEITLLGTAVINYLTARYTGLRLLEYLRFSSVFSPNITSHDHYHDDQAE